MRRGQLGRAGPYVSGGRKIGFFVEKFHDGNGPGDTWDRLESIWSADETSPDRGYVGELEVSGLDEEHWGRGRGTDRTLLQDPDMQGDMERGGDPLPKCDDRTY
ncbi:hypothetical protein GCM10022223_43360 [Kineosporia mesophila]|uniref:Uncharacterized protein n=1 Tax=Kineosporia mesophila TaxID=566012 RepID=A0ABP6ZY97_9ACTN